MCVCFYYFITLNMTRLRSKSIHLRLRAVDLHREGVSVRQTAIKLGCSTTLVLNALKKHEAQLPLEDASRAGRPTIISNRQSRALLKNPNQNRSQTSTELLLNTFGTEAYFSPRTLCRMLAKKGFRRVRASKVPLLTYLQQLRRYKFAIRYKHFKGGNFL